MNKQTVEDDLCPICEEYKVALNTDGSHTRLMIKTAPEMLVALKAAEYAMRACGWDEWLTDDISPEKEDLRTTCREALAGCQVTIANVERAACANFEEPDGREPAMNKAIDKLLIPGIDALVIVTLLLLAFAVWG